MNVRFRVLADVGLGETNRPHLVAPGEFHFVRVNRIVGYRSAEQIDFERRDDGVSEPEPIFK